MVCDFPSFPQKNGKSPKEENAAPSLRPENFPGHYPPRNSLPAVAQTGAPADATGEIFSLRAPASVQRGGEAGPMLNLYRTWGAGFIFDADVSHTRARPYIEMTTFLFMPWEVLCRVQARSLMLDMHPHIKANPHTLNNLFLHTQDYPANVAPHTHARSAADRARFCRAFFFPIRRRKAPRKCPAEPDSSFPLRPCAARRKKSACGHSFPRGREYGSSPRLSPAPKPDSSSGAAF